MDLLDGGIGAGRCSGREVYDGWVVFSELEHALFSQSAAPARHDYDLAREVWDVMIWGKTHGVDGMCCKERGVRGDGVDAMS